MPNRHHGSDDEVRALDAYVKMSRALGSVNRLLARRLADHGLTLSQLGVLEALFHLGPMCQRAMAEKLLLSGGNITTVVNNLERATLVRRERTDDDRRFVSLHLTEKGRALIESLFPAHAATIAAAIGVLSSEETATLARLCRTIGTSAGSDTTEIEVS